MAVAIDQILRLAPSISGPVEPVVSSTKATSTIGFGRTTRPAGSSDAKLRETRPGATARAAAKQAGKNARAAFANMGHPPENFRRGQHSQASRRRRDGIVADHRRIAGGF